MTEEREYTPRGFDVYCKFRDSYGSQIRVQRSSNAEIEACWIFAGDNPQMDDPSPHLSVADARVVRDALAMFIRESEEAAAAHMTGWAPGNLQSHLIHYHDLEPTEVPYDGPLDRLHREAHAREEEEERE